MTNTQDEDMAGLDQIRSSFIQWGQVGDFIRGTFTSKRQVPDKLKDKEHPGAMQWLYEILAVGGRYHKILPDKSVSPDPTIIDTGSFWIVSGKPGIDEGMRRVKVGQVVGFRFVEQKPSKQKGFNPNKVVVVYAGGMDPDYQGQSAEDIEQVVRQSGI